MKQSISKNWKQFKTFPCKLNNKIPATAHGYKDAQIGQDVESMVAQGYNVGLDCAGSGLIVLDLDFHKEDSNPIKEIEELESKLGKLPRTLTQKTASRKGCHLLFWAKGITNPKGKLSPNIDIKYNGYILIAPSKINGKQYKIIDGVDENGNFIIAELPQEWIDDINKDDKKYRTSAQKYTATPKERKLLKNINIEKMFDSCKYLQYCRDNADSLEEPMWHSMITILAQIDGADDLIHKLSSPYPKYNYAETQAKIDYARDFGYSQTCKYISENYPNACKGCGNASCDKMPAKAVADSMAISYEELKNSLELAQVGEV